MQHRKGAVRATVLAAAGAVWATGTAVPAAAQDSARIEALERQLQALQSELTRMRREMAPRAEATSPNRAARTRGGRETPPAPTTDTARAQPPVVGGPANVQPGSGQVAQDTNTAARSATTGPTQSAEQGRVSFPAGRPTFTSQDGRFSAAVGAQIHYDVGGYIRDERDSPDRRGVPNLNNFGENLRRGRIPFVFRYDDFQLNVTPEFGGSPDGNVSLYEANLNWTPIRPLTITGGYFKPWLTLADSTSSNDFLFLERPAIAEIARNIAAGDARSSIGARWAEERYFLSGYLTGGNYGSQSVNAGTPQQTGAAFRVAGRPVATEDWDVHLGFSASLAFDIGRTSSGQTINLQDRPELRIDQSRLISTGAINADGAHEWGPEFAVRWRNIMVQGEYIRIGVDQSRAGTSPRPDLSFEGGYAEASWVMTGEHRAYASSGGAFGGVRPRQPFNFREGHWGAFELVGRYSVADLNDETRRGRSASSTGGVFGGKQEIIGAGVNWYPSNNLRFMLQWNNVTVDRLNAAGTQQIGQRFDTVALRAQAAF